LKVNRETPFCIICVGRTPQMGFRCGFSVFLVYSFVKVIDRDLASIDLEEIFDIEKKKVGQNI